MIDLRCERPEDTVDIAVNQRPDGTRVVYVYINSRTVLRIDNVQPNQLRILP